MSKITTYEGVGETLEEAARNAHLKIMPRPHRDYTLSHVIEWGVQRGGFMDTTAFWVKLIEDRNGNFKT